MHVRVSHHWLLLVSRERRALPRAAPTRSYCIRLSRPTHIPSPRDQQPRRSPPAGSEQRQNARLNTASTDPEAESCRLYHHPPQHSCLPTALPGSSSSTQVSPTHLRAGRRQLLVGPPVQWLAQSKLLEARRVRDPRQALTRKPEGWQGGGGVSAVAEESPAWPAARGGSGARIRCPPFLRTCCRSRVSRAWLCGGPAASSRRSEAPEACPPAWVKHHTGHEQPSVYQLASASSARVVARPDSLWARRTYMEHLPPEAAQPGVRDLDLPELDAQLHLRLLQLGHLDLHMGDPCRDSE